jgi:PKD repeat protein
VARCSLDNILGPWEYYNGTGWTHTVTEAKKIQPQGYVSPSFSVIRQNGKYYLVTQDIGFLACGYGRKIFAYTSDRPEGPFINRQTIWLISDKYKGSYLVTYNTTAHPEFTENNEILISYNVNNTCPSQCVNVFTDRYNADLYRPKFVRVPFEVLDSGMIFPPEPYFTSSASQSEPLKVTFDPELSVAPEDIALYSWEFGDGEPVVVTDPFSKKVTHTFAGAGSYNVKLTITDKGGNTADTTLTINLTVTEVRNAQAFTDKIFPNPTRGSITVELDQYRQGEPVIIMIRNVAGQTIDRVPVSDARMNIEFTGNDGLYFVHVIRESNHKVYTVSLIKNR